VDATAVETTEKPITASERQAGENARVGIDASAGGRVTQGATSVDPDAQGTIVAHAITDRIVAYEAPDPSAAVVSEFDNPTEHGGPLVFAAEARPVDGWLEVLLPIRPNGSTGWIKEEDVDLSINPYRIEVNASQYSLTIYRYGREQMSTTVAIGNGDTPTPIGKFYLIELLRPSNPNGAYGPFAYGLSGYSETLESFNGGDGVIGIHGTNRADQLGQDVSHGCIRVANPTITEMTKFLPLGTPVVITRDA
jgi:lipoprotein-anchoring transpeptidase ErfK/SrfK